MGVNTYRAVLARNGFVRIELMFEIKDGFLSVHTFICTFFAFPLQRNVC